MGLTRQDKEKVVEEVAAQLAESQAVFAVDYRGITVAQAQELRTKLAEAGARFRVTKNTLARLAAERAGREALKEVLVGPTALTFVAPDGDPVLAAKAIATFRREHDVLEPKGGLLGEAVVDAAELARLAALPGREQLVAQLVGLVAMPLTGVARGLGQLLGGLAVQLEQIRERGLIGGAEAGDAAAGGGED